MDKKNKSKPKRHKSQKAGRKQNALTQSRLSRYLKKIYSTKSGSFLINVILLLFSISVLFVVLEIGSRIIIKPNYDKWFVGPSYNFIEWRKAHFAGESGLFRKSKLYNYSNRINILGLGDSFTFASGVFNVEDTHLALLEKKLNESSLPVLVNNVATPGNNINEILESAKKYIPMVKPDIVLYSIVLNDPANRPDLNQVSHSVNLLPYIGKYLSRSYFYSYINSQFSSLIKSIFFPLDTYRNYENYYREENLAAFDNGIVKLKELCGQNNADLVASILPLMDNFKDYKFVEFHEKIISILEKHNVKYIDTLPYFKSFEDARKLWIHPYDSHPNEIAQNVFAEAENDLLVRHISNLYSDKLASFTAEGIVQVIPLIGVLVESKGRTLYSEGKFEEAIAIFNDELKKDPSNYLLYSWIGTSYLELKNYDSAKLMYHKALQYEPDYPIANENLAKTYLVTNELEKAIKYFDILVRLKPDDADAHYNLGETYNKLKRYEESIEPLKEAIRINPDFADAHNDLAVTYDFLGRYDEAIESLKEASRINPNFAKIHYNLGIVYLKRRNKKAALDEYNILKELDKKVADDLLDLINKLD